MRGAGRWVAVAITVVATAIGGCSDTDDEPAGGTVATAATTTTTDPYAVPEVIDVAYVNRVLAGLDAAVGDVVRLVVRTRSIPPEAVDRLRALYADEEAFQLALDTINYDLQDTSALHEVPGNVSTEVRRFISASATCVFVEVHRNYEAIARKPNPALSRQWIGLASSQPAAGYNPTPWRILYEGFTQDLSEPANPCEDS